jgi:hypothetical protein
MTYIESLQDAIQRLHGCDSAHVESVPVREEHDGNVIWEGAVEVFKLTGHQWAKECYAWGHADGENDSGSRYVAVLKSPPIESPRAAVRAAIIDRLKRGG